MSLPAIRDLLAPEEVHLWIAEPPALDDPELLAAYDALMTDDERARQRAYVHERNRREALVTRALVRASLSQYRAIAPSAWRFRIGEHGRPEIDPPCGLRFNLSNHPSMVVCAIVLERDIGVDVEPMTRGEEILSVADTVFAPSELAELRALSAPEEADRAVTLWTLKEAYIKARGKGLSLPLDAFAFHFAPGAPPVVSFDPRIDDRAARWTFRTCDVRGHRIALAVDGPVAAVRLREGIPRLDGGDQPR